MNRRTMTGIAIVTAGLGLQGFAQTTVTLPSWVESMTFKGDIRYRVESINDDSKKDASGDTYTRERERIRARLSAEAKCNDNLKVGIGLSTGQSDPVSGNQTIGDGFGKKEFRLDTAWLDYNFFGDNPNEVHAIAGKMKNPFITYPDDLIWDPDLTPEGVAVKAQAGNDFVTLSGNAGYLWVQERADKSDAMIYAGQAAVKFQFAPEVALTLGGSYYGYQNVQGYDVIDWENKNNAYGNSTQNGTIVGTTTNKAWASGYTPVVGFAALDVWVGTVPVTVYAQGVKNTDASTRFDQGQLYGVTVGKAKNPKTFEVGYSYAKLEKDATIGMFTDSDRWGGGTDGKGHKLYAKYQIMKNLQAGIAYFLDDKKISDSAKTTDYDRLQVDLVAAF